MKKSRILAFVDQAEDELAAALLSGCRPGRESRIDGLKSAMLAAQELLQEIQKGA